MLSSFRNYLFDWNGTTLHVFYLIWEDGNRDVDPTVLGQDWSGISGFGLVKEILANRPLRSCFLEGCSLLQPGTNNGPIFGACFFRQPSFNSISAAPRDRTPSRGSASNGLR